MSIPVNLFQYNALFQCFCAILLSPTHRTNSHPTIFYLFSFLALWCFTLSIINNNNNNDDDDDNNDNLYTAGHHDKVITREFTCSFDESRTLPIHCHCLHSPSSFSTTWPKNWDSSFSSRGGYKALQQGCVVCTSNVPSIAAVFTTDTPVYRMCAQVAPSAEYLRGHGRFAVDVTALRRLWQHLFIAVVFTTDTRLHTVWFDRRIVVIVTWTFVMHMLLTSSSAMAARPHDACSSTVIFD